MEKLKRLLRIVTRAPLAKLVAWFVALFGLVFATTATIAVVDSGTPRLVATIVLIPATIAFVGTALVVGIVTLARILDDLERTWRQDVDP